MMNMKNWKMWAMGAAVLAGLSGAVGVAQAAEEGGGSTAKQIYYEPPANEEDSSLAMRYSILTLNEDDEVEQVTEKKKFGKGDRFRLSFEVNRDGYLYVFSRGEDAEAGERLFPDERIYGGRNKVKERTGITLPPAKSGWFRFGTNEGDEQVFVFFSKEPIDDLAALVPGADASSKSSVSAAAVSEAASQSKAHDGASAQQIYYEEPEEEGAPANGYIATDADILIHQINLKRK